MHYLRECIQDASFALGINMKRIVLAEGARCSKTISTLAKELGLNGCEFVSSLYAADANLSKRLSVSSLLSVDRDGFSFGRIAGVFPVTEQLEIEVVPKFMSGNEAWRTDFLLLLTRTRWGALAERQMVSAAKSRDCGINDSLAIVFLTMFDEVSHVPIRTYRQRILRQFEIEGDLNEETIFLPDRDGFAQTVTEFTRKNDYNAIIAEAAKILSRSASDFDLRARLARAVYHLGPQGNLPSNVPSELPSRFKNWADIYGLSIDVLDGYGVDYVNQGEILAPGFVVRTADAWEEFIRQALVAGMKGCSVTFQEKHPFAKRGNSTIKVRPDYTIRTKDGRELLVDAKYKYNDASKGTISNADIYEGWAFMEAAGIHKLVLLYPCVGSSMDGSFEQFQTVTNDEKLIVGVRVNPELAGFSGLAQFAAALAEYLAPMMVMREAS